MRVKAAAAWSPRPGDPAELADAIATMFVDNPAMSRGEGARAEDGGAGSRPQVRLQEYHERSSAVAGCAGGMIKRALDCALSGIGLLRLVAAVDPA